MYIKCYETTTKNKMFNRKCALIDTVKMHRHAKCCKTDIHILFSYFAFWKMDDWMWDRKKKQRWWLCVCHRRGSNHKIQSLDPVKHDLYFSLMSLFLHIPIQLILFFHSTHQFLSTTSFFPPSIHALPRLYHTINQFEYFLVCHFSLFEFQSM